LVSEGFLTIVSHSSIIVVASIVVFDFQGRVELRSHVVLDEGVAGRIVDLKGEGKDLTIFKFLKLDKELVNLSGGGRIELASLSLHVTNSLNRVSEKAFGSVNGSLLSLGRDLELKLGNSDSSEFRLDN